MLIINADDLGKDEVTTRSILRCHRHGRISSGSAMVFMRDSERAAEASLQEGLDSGLHLNFTQPFSALRNKPLLENFHKSIAGFLARTRYCPLYNPLLRRQFEYVTHAQLEEFMRLYGVNPSHVDGHEHMHLCANMIIQKVLPVKSRVRRSFHFFRGEKGVAKRLYRRFLNGWVSRNFVSTDYFFDVEPILESRLSLISTLSKTSEVELMVHPERKPQLDYLLSDRFHALLSAMTLGTWNRLGTS